MTDRALRRRRLRRAAVAAALVGLSAVAIVVSVSRQQATKARDQARADALRAEASRLLTLGQLRLADDPTEALAFATASLELADTPEARVFVMKALWEAPPSFTLPVGPPSQREPAFSPDGTKLAAGDHDPVELLWNESGGSPPSLEGNEISPRGSNVAGWSADRHLVTGLCCALATRAHVWSADGNRRADDRVRRANLVASREGARLRQDRRGPPGEPCGAAALLAAEGWPAERPRPRPEAPPAPSAFLPDATGLAYARDSALFVRTLPPGTGAGDRLVGRHGSDIVELADRRDDVGPIALTRQVGRGTNLDAGAGPARPGARHPPAGHRAAGCLRRGAALGPRKRVGRQEGAPVGPRGAARQQATGAPPKRVLVPRRAQPAPEGRLAHRVPVFRSCVRPSGRSGSATRVSSTATPRSPGRSPSARTVDGSRRAGPTPQLRLWPVSGTFRASRGFWSFQRRRSGRASRSIRVAGTCSPSATATARGSFRSTGRVRGGCRSTPKTRSLFAGRSRRVGGGSRTAWGFRPGCEDAEAPRR